MQRLLALTVLTLVIVTVGCGFAIRFGGESFQGAVKGHMVLGLLALACAILLAVNVLK
jgi:hypothetical protein